MPPSSQPGFENLNFAAPIGVRVRVVTALVFVILVAIGFMPFFLRAISAHSSPDELAWLGPAIALPIVIVILLLAIVREYRLVGSELHVIRLGRVNRYPLEGLTQAEANRDAMFHAWKKWGNDGLGAITGRFRSKQLGSFEALLTDANHAVVLRWPERTLVVSPEREAYFVQSVRERANLRG
jgi:hypothetical protein